MTRTLALDPGAHVGLAVWNGKEITTTHTYLWTKRRDQLEAAILALYEPGAVAVIERPGHGYWGKAGVGHSYYCASVGACRMRSDELARSCKKCGYEVHQKPPVRGGTKRAITRAAFDYRFPELRGKRISEHARDACMIAAFWGPRLELLKRAGGGVKEP